MCLSPPARQRYHMPGSSWELEQLMPCPCPTGVHNLPGFLPYIKPLPARIYYLICTWVLYAGCRGVWG